MLVLDTDHLTEYQKGTSTESLRLKQRLGTATDAYATTIITVEEVMRGWMAAVRRTSNPHQQIKGYRRLHQLFQFFSVWTILEWDQAAADIFESLRHQKVRGGTMDLKIACICRANNALLLSRNKRDFENVPGLSVENWLS